MSKVMTFCRGVTAALLVFAVFTFWPFFQSIYLSFFVTDQAGVPVRFNDVKYYSRILNLDGSGRYEHTKGEAMRETKH